MERKTAFTLAEILITLGIIGVVAAITMPTLVANYQKHVFVNQLKKSYSVFSQALNKIMADEGVTSLNDTEFATIANAYNACTSNAESDEQTSACKVELTKSIYNLLKKYLNTADIKPLENYSYTYLNYDGTVDMSGQYAMFLSDGTIILECGLIYFTVDINGLKGPNIVGRDIFYFSSDNDRFFPKGSKAASALMHKRYGGGVRAREWENGSMYYNCRTDVSSPGYGCAGRIFDVGKMDY